MYKSSDCVWHRAYRWELRLSSDLTPQVCVSGSSCSQPSSCWTRAGGACAQVMRVRARRPLPADGAHGPCSWFLSLKTLSFVLWEN